MAKLFDKWDLDEVEVQDLGLKRYICLDETIVPHTAENDTGKYGESIAAGETLFEKIINIINPKSKSRPS